MELLGNYWQMKALVFAAALCNGISKKLEFVQWSFLGISVLVHAAMVCWIMKGGSVCQKGKFQFLKISLYVDNFFCSPYLLLAVSE